MIHGIPVTGPSIFSPLFMVLKHVTILIFFAIFWKVNHRTRRAMFESFVDSNGKQGRWMNYDWLVVEPPLWKIWVRQLGRWHSQLNGKIKNIPKHQMRNSWKFHPPKLLNQRIFFHPATPQSPTPSSTPTSTAPPHRLSPTTTGKNQVEEIYV